MKTIVAPTDFSRVSINAVYYAADMAAEIDAELLLLHTAELPLTMTEYAMYDSTGFSVNREDDLNELKQTILKRTKNKIVVHTEHTNGTIEFELKKVCENKKPFAVVMGTHCPGLLERLFTGSVTVYTARHLSYPVLVVPQGLTYSPIRKIALAADLKSIYGIAKKEIETILNTFHATLDIIHINTGHTDTGVERSLMGHYLKAFNPGIYEMHGSNKEEGIEAFAIQHNIDLLLILPQKHGVFHKSLSEKIIYHSAIPAMSIHEV